jgi:hypothetical protein
MYDDDDIRPYRPMLSLIYPVGETLADINEFVAAVENHTTVSVMAGLDCPEERCQTYDNYLYQRLVVVFDMDTCDGVLVYPGWETCEAAREAVRTAYRAKLPIYRLGMTDDGPTILPRIEVVGIAGWAQSGKDTTALTLTENEGYYRASFADVLRDIVTKVNPIIGFNEDGQVRYVDAVSTIGYEETKRRYPESRRILQTLGTEGVRDTLDAEAWPIALYLNARDGARVVVPDVRFENEIEFVHFCEGEVWWVSRPSVPAPPDAHASEVTLTPDHCDRVIVNDGTPIDLARKASEAIRQMREQQANDDSDPDEWIEVLRPE